MTKLIGVSVLAFTRSKLLEVRLILPFSLIPFDSELIYLQTPSLFTCALLLLSFSLLILSSLTGLFLPHVALPHRLRRPPRPRPSPRPPLFLRRPWLRARGRRRGVDGGSDQERSGRPRVCAV
jgi:hypothetical protein